jgi:hypothetical protein
MTKVMDFPRDEDEYRRNLAEIEAKSGSGTPSTEPKDKKTTKGEKQAAILVKIALSDGIDLFHTPDREPFATLVVNGHRETYRVNSRKVRQWLQHRFYTEEGKPAGSQAMQDAVGTLEAMAVFDGQTDDVFLRVGRVDGRIYIDLGTPEWNAVEVSPSGWQITEEPPIRFYRATGSLPLPVPRKGGSLDLLRDFINVKSRDDFYLLVAFILAAIRPEGPYPVLDLEGEQGSAKSTTAKLVKALVDPTKPTLRAAPRENRDLMIAARNGWCLAYDNLSGISDWLSDAMCRLATGGGFSTRTLYTNDEEELFDSQRPQILNGIADPAERDDLRDRSVILTLPPISDRNRKTEEEFWAHFAAVSPLILGALYTAASGALKRYPATKLERQPRMADFAKWTVAAEPTVGWKAGSFLAAYSDNRQTAVAAILEGSPVAAVLLDWAPDEWTGTATELLKTLEGRVGDDCRKHPEWPRQANVLSRTLNRVAPALRKAGLDIQRPQARTILIRTVRENTVDTVKTVTRAPSDDGYDDVDGDSRTHSTDDYDRDERLGMTEG